MVFVRNEGGLQFNSTHLPQPGQVAVLMFVLVEHRKLVSALLHRLRDVARDGSVNWPGPIC